VSTGDHENPHKRASWNPPTWLAWAAVAVAVAVTVVIVWNSSGPAFFTDEISTMGMAKLFADPANPWTLGGGSFLPLTGILLTPIWWFTQDPATAYRAAIIVLAVVSLSAIWPFAKIGRFFGLTRNAAVVVASIVAVAPGHAIQANYVWSEQVLALVTALTVWRGLVFARDRTTANAVWFGVVGALAFVAHGRAIVVSATAGIALLAFAVKRWRAAWPGIVAYSVVLGVGLLAFRFVSRTLYRHDIRTSHTFEFLGNGTPATFVEQAVSQTWYAIVPWLGLVFLGTVFLVRKSRRGEESAVAVRWILAAFGASFVFVVVLLAGSVTPFPRVDLYVYGRYLDFIALPLALIGIVALVQGVRMRVLALTALSGAVATAAFLIVVAPHIPDGGRWDSPHIPELAMFLDPGLIGRGAKDSWGSIAAVLGVMVLLVLALARRRLVAVAVVAAYFVFASVWTDQHVALEHERSARSRPPMLVALDGVPDEYAVYSPLTIPHVHDTENAYVFWAYPREFVTFENPEDMTGVLVYAPRDYQPAIDAGALPLNGSAFALLWVWVYPGELYDQLDAEGRLAHPTDEDA
jgi:hypothetical protein